MKDNIMQNMGVCSRRSFLSRTGAVLALAALEGLSTTCDNKGKTKKRKSTAIKHVDCNFERDPLIRPFGFKGGYTTQLWQTAALMQSNTGEPVVGLGTQSVLWSDASVFATHSESAGNGLMFMVIEKALKMIEGQIMSDPIELLNSVFDDIYVYGKQITGNPKLRKTFVLNALVAFDNAAWLLYSQQNNISHFDDMIPDIYKPALSYQHEKLASIPLMTYGIPIQEIKEAAEKGYFFMKIKIGQPGTQEEMLEKDKARIEAIHKAIGDIETPHTKDGKIPYYFDANGRYETKETLFKLLDHAKKIGAFDRIAIMEEPFPEEYEIDVSGFGLCMAADESADTDEDALKRIQMGYKAIALKPIAKTLSMSLKIAKIAHDNNVSCFCADLTVNPILVDWNKNVAARLAPFPGLSIGLLESNGHQNYKNWNELITYHPCAGASWMATKDGLFNLNNDFYEKSGCIYMPSDHYMNLFKKSK